MYISLRSRCVLRLISCCRVMVLVPGKYCGNVIDKPRELIDDNLHANPSNPQVRPKRIGCKAMKDKLYATRMYEGERRTFVPVC